MNIPDEYSEYYAMKSNCSLQEHDKVMNAFKDGYEYMQQKALLAYCRTECIVHCKDTKIGKTNIELCCNSTCPLVQNFLTNLNNND